jgi:quinolinate synthase
MTLSEQIRALCREKNAIIMAHYYQRPEIQDVADFVGDSLALAQLAAKTDADIIVMCGVHFMAETAKILCPSKKVLIPEPAAGCSLADSCRAEDLAAWKALHPNHLIVSYVNTSAAVKALTDVVVTSSNALKIVNQLPENQSILFGPDQNLGGYINRMTGRQMELWNGGCHVHARFSEEALLQLKTQYPDAQV